MLQVTRRKFLEVAGAAVAAEKLVDGGFALVSVPGVPKRKTPLIPAGAGSLKDFRRKCVACQLCVKHCPAKVLRPSKDAPRLLQPEMGFEHGYCRTACSRCAEVCPAGAILPLTEEEKRHTRIGHAIWHRDRCLAAVQGVKCNACERHCPVKAIQLINGLPVIDKGRCIGCGACENLCPARPLPGITVKGYQVHRFERPVTPEETASFSPEDDRQRPLEQV
jgi:formate hydrogenlyase subunit 6/NADH:ubiquinone oxidoreductase subunit I